MHPEEEETLKKETIYILNYKEVVLFPGESACNTTLKNITYNYYFQNDLNTIKSFIENTSEFGKLSSLMKAKISTEMRWTPKLYDDVETVMSAYDEETDMSVSWIIMPMKPAPVNQ